MKMFSVKNINKRLTGVGVVLLTACYLFVTGAVAQESTKDPGTSGISYQRDFLSYGDVWAFDQTAYKASKYGANYDTKIIYDKKGGKGSTEPNTAEYSTKKYFAEFSITNGNTIDTVVPMEVLAFTEFQSNVKTGSKKTPIEDLAEVEKIPEIPVVEVNSSDDPAIYSVVPDEAGTYYIYAYSETETPTSVKYALLNSCSATNAYAEKGFSQTLTFEPVDTAPGWYRASVDVDYVTWYAITMSCEATNGTTDSGNIPPNDTTGGKYSSTVLNQGGDSTTYYYNVWKSDRVYYNTVLVIQFPSTVSLGPIAAKGTITISNTTDDDGVLTAANIFGEPITVDGTVQSISYAPILLYPQASVDKVYGGFTVNGEDITLTEIISDQTYLYSFEETTTIGVKWAEPASLPTITITGDDKTYNFLNATVGTANFTKGTLSTYTVTMDFTGADGFQSAAYTVTGDIVDGASTKTVEISKDDVPTDNKYTFTVLAKYDQTTIKITANDIAGKAYEFNYTIAPNTTLLSPVAKNNDTQYYFIEDALSDSTAGTIVLLKDATFQAVNRGSDGVRSAKWNTADSSGNLAGYTVKSGVTLLVPYSDSDDGNEIATSSGGSMGKVFRTLTVPSDVNLTVVNGGTLIVNAVQSCTSTVYMGNIGGKYGKVALEGSIELYGVLKARGVISGEGNIHAYANSDIYQFIQFTDFRGGTATYAIYTSGNNKPFPMNQFYLQNIQVMTRYDSGSEMYGCYFIAAGGEEKSGSALLIGSSDKTLFQIESGYLTMDYNADKAKSVVDIYGTVGVNEFEVTATVKILFELPITLNTSDYQCPISAAFDVNVRNQAILNVTQEFKILPGCIITIDDGGTLNIPSGGALYLYDVADYQASYAVGETGYCFHNYRRTPLTFGNTTITETEDGSLIVNGTVNVDGALYCSTNTTGTATATASSSIRTSADTGIINMNTVSSTVTIKEGLQQSSGATTVSSSFGPARGWLVSSATEEYTSFTQGTWYSNGQKWYQHKVTYVNGKTDATLATQYTAAHSDTYATTMIEPKTSIFPISGSPAESAAYASGTVTVSNLVDGTKEYTVALIGLVAEVVGIEDGKYYSLAAAANAWVDEAEYIQMHESDECTMLKDGTVIDLNGNDVVVTGEAADAITIYGADTQTNGYGIGSNPPEPGSLTISGTNVTVAPVSYVNERNYVMYFATDANGDAVKNNDGSITYSFHRFEITPITCGFFILNPEDIESAHAHLGFEAALQGDETALSKLVDVGFAVKKISTDGDGNNVAWGWYKLDTGEEILDFTGSNEETETESETAEDETEERLYNTVSMIALDFGTTSAEYDVSYIVTAKAAFGEVNSAGENYDASVVLTSDGTHAVTNFKALLKDWAAKEENAAEASQITAFLESLTATQGG